MTVVLERSVADLAVAEGATGRRRQRVPGGGRSRALGWTILAAVVLATVTAGIGRRAIVNAGGWTLMLRFWRAAAHPDLSRQFVARTGAAALTTVAYAVLGTALSLVIGVVGGVLLSRRALSRAIRRDRPHAVLRVARIALVVPRGIHEAVWALVLLSVLGRDPIVAVLAIGVPYGAITAKVYADILDEAARREQRTLRAAGANRIQALLYGTLPSTGADLIGYGFYRLECALRAAVVLGMVGTGGLGFQLSQSFQGLAYREMWTTLYALLVLGALAEWWSATVRRGGASLRRQTAVVGAVLVAGSWWHLAPSLTRLWSAQTRGRAHRWFSESWPPRLPRHGWRELGRATVATVHLSFLAIVLAVALAAPIALLGARVGQHQGHGRVRTAIAAIAKLVALAARSIPATVWALLALFVFFPGVVPGAIALGIYTAGVLVRLFAEAIENTDDRPRATLVASGARPLAAFAYGTVPALRSRWAAYALYRWEVAARDAAVVGVVGVAGLGRLLAEQTAGFAYPRMTTTVLALVVVTVLVDAISSVVRGTLR